MKDIVKAVIYDRGTKELNGQTKYFSLVAMIIASDKPLVTAEVPEIIAMGEMNICDELQNLPKYACPHKFGDISNAIVSVSQMSPDDLDRV